LKCQLPASKAEPLGDHYVKAEDQRSPQLPKFQGEVIRDDRGREVVCFTTPSGVRAVVDTSIPQEALAKLAAKLMRKLARRKGREQNRFQARNIDTRDR
jgi:ribosome-associated translation inhibitor RaiA